jgi:pimeloyl-ACP methyl ester carboxylesterase
MCRKEIAGPLVNGNGGHMARFILGILLLSVVAASTALEDGAAKSGYATAHDGSSVYYEVHGRGSRFLLMGFQLQPHHPQLAAFVEGLGKDYRIIVATYPPGETDPNFGDPMMYTFTPAAVARDYLAIASAAGADEFAYYGYSWGAACGLQLAIRSGRVKALVSGGFPMIDGPYREILSAMRLVMLGDAKADTSPESMRQYMTYYEGLQSFNDRSIQSKLKMPRLNFVGTQDRVNMAGRMEVEYFNRFTAVSKELKAAGWDVMSIPDKDHATATAPEVIVPLLRKWLAENWHRDAGSVSTR